MISCAIISPHRCERIIAKLLSVGDVSGLESNCQLQESQYSPVCGFSRFLKVWPHEKTRMRILIASKWHYVTSAIGEALNDISRSVCRIRQITQTKLRNWVLLLKKFQRFVRYSHFKITFRKQWNEVIERKRMTKCSIYRPFPTGKTSLKWFPPTKKIVPK